MDVIEAIYHRRAVRAYTGEPVDQEILKSLVDAAIQAPSAVNQQPWSFAIVRDKDLLDRISRESRMQMLANLPAVPASGHFRELLSDPDFQIFYHAPALIVISAMAASPWAVEDCSLAAENLMLAAGVPTTLEPDQQADAECERNAGKQMFEVHRYSPGTTQEKSRYLSPISSVRGSLLSLGSPALT